MKQQQLGNKHHASRLIGVSINFKTYFTIGINKQRQKYNNNLLSTPLTLTSATTHLEPFKIIIMFSLQL